MAADADLFRAIAGLTRDPADVTWPLADVRRELFAAQRRGVPDDLLKAIERRAKEARRRTGELQPQHRAFRRIAAGDV
jgi:hypothetical protein